MMTKRAARADSRALLLGAPEIAPAGHRLPPGKAFGSRREHRKQLAAINFKYNRFAAGAATRCLLITSGVGQKWSFAE